MTSLIYTVYYVTKPINAQILLIHNNNSTLLKSLTSFTWAADLSHLSGAQRNGKEWEALEMLNSTVVSPGRMPSQFVRFSSNVSTWAIITLINLIIRQYSGSHIAKHWCKTSSLSKNVAWVVSPVSPIIDFLWKWMLLASDCRDVLPLPDYF